MTRPLLHRSSVPLLFTLLLAPAGPAAAAAQPATPPQQSKPQQTKPEPEKPQQGKPLPPPMRPGQTVPGEDYGPASVAKAAREALEAGKAEEAIATAERVLVRLPGRSDAAQVKIEALFALRKPGEAVEAYEAFFKANAKDDPAILRAMGRAVLRQIAGTPSELASPAALGALAKAGDAKMKQKLVDQAQSTKDASLSLLANEALARMGDAKAIDSLMTLAASDSANTSASALKALGELHVQRAAPVVVKALESRNVLVKLMAITAAGRVKATAAKPVLLKAAQDRPLLLQLQACGALLALGDRTGVDTLKQALASDFADVKLAAANALAEGSPSDTSWHAAIKPVLSNPDGLNRFQAAELLLTADRPAALDVLTRGAADQNPAIRTEVARIVADDPKADLALLRRFLPDASPWARLHAASRLARLP